MIDAVLRDVRFAVRALRRSPAFTIVAVLTFGVGIGMNVAVFSVLDRVLFRPLPYNSPGSLVLLRDCGGEGECSGTIPAVVAYEGQRLASFDGFAAAGFAASYSATRDGNGPPMRLIGTSPQLLRVLRVTPVRGRDFTDEDATSKRAVALVSYESWQSRFGGSEDIVGKEVWSRAGPTTIVGVLPDGFIPPAANAHDPRWEGLVLTTTWVAIEPTGRMMPPVARLKAGVTLEQARSEVAALVAALEPVLRQPGSTGPTIRVDPIQQTLFARFRSNFWLLLGTTALLLVLACANLATLLLAYGRSRDREAAIAAALGASTPRLMGQALLTSFLVCVAGSAIALGAVFAASRGLAAILPPLIARYASGATDPRVLVLALVAAIACAVAAGLVPSLRTARVDLLQVLQRTPQFARRSRLRGGVPLLAVESAIGVVLVLTGLLMLRSFSRLAGDDLGFAPEGLYTVTWQSANRELAREPLALYEQALDALQAVPGVVAVGGADSPVSAFAPMRPLSNDRSTRGGRFEVSASYFDAIGARFLAGRGFTEGEVRSRARVAIVSRAAAGVLWPAMTPEQVVGAVLALPKESSFRVVGVVPDLKTAYGQDGIDPALYVPLGLGPSRYIAASVRMQPGVPADLAAFRQHVVERIGPATVSLSPVAVLLEPGLQDPRFRAVLFVTLALAAVLLAATGLYAVAAFDVRERQYEMGVRLSCGATARDLQRMVVAQTCRPVTAGILIGLGAAYASVRFLQQFLYQVEARDPWMYAAVSGILLATGVASAWLPAWRAGRLDPSVVLRAQ